MFKTKVNTRRIKIKKGGYTFTFTPTERLKLILTAIECEKSFGDCYPSKYIYLLALRQGYAILNKQLKK